MSPPGAAPVCRIRSSEHGATLLEWYAYEAGPAEALPEHLHREVQVGFHPDAPGVYEYRGELHYAGIGSVTVLEPMEPHSIRDPGDRAGRATYRMAYLPPELLADAFGTGVEVEPRFPRPVLDDRSLAAAWVGFHRAVERDAPILEIDTAQAEAVARLVGLWSSRRGPARTPADARPEVRRAREYLDSNLSRRVSLEDVAAEAGLSPYHLLRVFKRRVGVTPFVYHRQRRLDRARRLLARGHPIAAVALRTGFADQGHLTRHFKRLVGVTPGRYEGRKNLQ